MKITKYNPSSKLSPYINSILTIESEKEITNHLLPGTAPVMAFRFKGIVNLNHSAIPAFVVTGLSKTVRSVNYTAGSGVLLILFKEIGAMAFTNIPIHEFAGASIDLTHVFATEKLNRLEEHLFTAETNVARVAMIEEFLTRHIRHREEDSRIRLAIDLIKKSEGKIRINEVAATLHTNIDSFEKKFRTQVGTSPKNFSSIIRFRSIIENYETSKNLTEVAYDWGFSDQAHFNREFKNFTGQSPTRFFEDYHRRW